MMKNFDFFRIVKNSIELRTYMCIHTIFQISRSSNFGIIYANVSTNFYLLYEFDSRKIPFSKLKKISFAKDFLP